jgi:hypothetical protein
MWDALRMPLLLLQHDVLWLLLLHMLVVLMDKHLGLMLSIFFSLSLTEGN